MVSRTVNAPEAGYMDPYDILGEDGWLGMNVHQMLAALTNKGYIYRIAQSDGMMANFNLSSKSATLVNAIIDRGLDIGPWTVAYGPDSLWGYSYLFKNADDAVLARLILE